MRFFTARLLESQDLGGAFSWLRLAGCSALAASRPGQFVMVRGAWGRDPLLPRAYSVLWASGDEAELLVHRVGRGSNLLAAARPGDAVTVLGPLGSVFPPPAAGELDMLVAGGCGVAPLYFAARRGERGSFELLVGARTAAELVLLDRLADAGVVAHVATEDGTRGMRGLVTDLLGRRLAEGSRRAARILACGPEGMLLAVREVARQHRLPCLLSVEAPMACGVGACLGCAVPARSQPYRYVCQEGPVFDAEEVWP
jgi:dihydroorotate dehydrogenase electron transfer subunit